MEPREVEEKLAELLSEGEMETVPKEQAVKKKLPFKTEIRIRTAFDPIAVETKAYRRMAKEIDGRYDRYED
ncbi:hypothetical protein ACFQI7_03565 [Paenibacillus allorhizosphaerae]|uniref:Uncharacterized protein n=1 Tax=Paenibacillus allorhizosphaerae TaxID=2849866 RepID=A0ABN7TDE8_9BACL|nr:hypothetical protein [Paenibacillus allorhizosphaerae]CAG7624927.1 hypothetical protein PAECIP111802_01114 [Paenibacillus allorhizosphaerae]